MHHREWQFYTQTSIKHPHNLSLLQKVAALTLLQTGGELDQKNCDDSEPELHDRTFDEGDSIDCLDSDIKWLLAIVKKKVGSDIYVHWDGFKSEYDEWLSTDDCRIAPYGTFSGPFTTPPRR